MLRIAMVCTALLLSSALPTYALDASEREWALKAIAIKENAITTDLPADKENRCASNLPSKRLIVCVTGFESVVAGREAEKMRLKLMLAADDLSPKEKAKFANILSLKAYDEINTKTTALYNKLVEEFPERVSALSTQDKSR
jgi:hypothetical protein